MILNCYVTKVTRWLVVSALDFRSEGRWFNSLEKKLYSTLSLHHGVIADDKPEMDYHPIQGAVAILLVTSRYINRVKLRPCGLPVARVRLYFYLNASKSIECRYRLYFLS